MAKIFAVIIVLIAIASAVPIVMHWWPMPQDISVHGHLIDEQYTDTMLEAGISFLASQFLLAFFIFKFSSSKARRQDQNFPRRRHRNGGRSFPAGGNRSFSSRRFRNQGVGQRLLHAARRQCSSDSGPSGPVRILFPLSRSRWHLRSYSRRPDQRSQRQFLTAWILRTIRIPKTTLSPPNLLFR